MSTSRLGPLLKTYRRRLAPDARVLGGFERLPSRVGKPVTQEELAEAAGVTRQWYSLVEAGARTGVSLHFIGRLADVFGLTPAERREVLGAAVPALERTQVQPRSLEVLDAFSWMRIAAKRLWLASSETECLTAATEAVASRLRDAPHVQNLIRAANGTWSSGSIIAPAERIRRSTECTDELNGIVGPEALDAIRFYPQASQPGDLWNERAFDSVASRESVHGILRRYGFQPISLLCARVRTRRGLVAGLHVVQRAAETTAEDMAIISAVADLTSLALT